ncbi:hypothetical protein PoB_007334700 [Plakobranchus ocellatus]|uniref:Uncharacterized protein n=1 Tax=Plakobranchus ocellatus TaxID=259542 RepID=A0AAV4DRB4_9GAST|nr:hypothetical protein PoB_007334700 [Plakobranchus ocellatus]
MATVGRTKPCPSGQLCPSGRGHFGRGSFITSPKFNRDTYAQSLRAKKEKLNPPKWKQVHRYVRICLTKRAKSHRSLIPLYINGEKASVVAAHLVAAKGDTMAIVSRIKPCPSGQLRFSWRGHFGRDNLKCTTSVTITKRYNNRTLSYAKRQLSVLARIRKCERAADEVQEARRKKRKLAEQQERNFQEQLEGGPIYKSGSF